MITKEMQLGKKRYRKRKCKVCREWFRPINEGQPVCAEPECAIPFAKEKKAREDRKAKRASRQQELSALKERVQKVCNAYIRARDNKAKLPCISCGYIWVAPHIGRVQNAGHYQSVGKRADLRYNEDNIHLQCVFCNAHDGGGLIPLYRDNLIKKIGIDKVEMLESNNTPRSYSVDELLEIEAYYKEKLKKLGEKNG